LYNQFASAFANSQVDILGPGIISGLQALRAKYVTYLIKLLPFVETLEAQLLVDLFNSNYRARLATESDVILIDTIIAKIQKRIDAIKAGN
jgi:hypothetical protein